MLFRSTAAAPLSGHARTLRTSRAVTGSPQPASPRAPSGSLLPAPRRSCRYRRRRRSGWLTRLPLGEVWRCRLDVKRSASLSLPPAGGARGCAAREGAGPRGGAKGAEGRGLPRPRSANRERAAPFAAFPARCFSLFYCLFGLPSASEILAGYNGAKSLKTVRIKNVPFMQTVIQSPTPPNIWWSRTPLCWGKWLEK